LRASHVNTAGDLAAIGTRVSATAALGAMLEMDRAELARRIALAGLLTLPGVDLARAAVLRAAGFADPAAVSAADPADLVARYGAAAGSRDGDDGWRPAPDLAAQWVVTAAALEARRTG